MDEIFGRVILYIYITAIALDEFAHSFASSGCVDNKTFSHFIYTIIESIPLNSFM